MNTVLFDMNFQNIIDVIQLLLRKRNFINLVLINIVKPIQTDKNDPKLIKNKRSKTNQKVIQKSSKSDPKLIREYDLEVIKKSSTRHQQSHQKDIKNSSKTFLKSHQKEIFADLLIKTEKSFMITHITRAPSKKPNQYKA